MRFSTKIYVIIFAITISIGNIYGSRFRQMSSKEGLSDLMISSLYKDSAGFVWIGSLSCISRFDGIRFRQMKPDPSMQRLRWVNVITQCNGRLLVGCETGLYEVSNNTSIVPIFDSFLKGKAVRSIISGENGEIYLATSGGLAVISGDKIQLHFVFDNQLSPSNHIRAMERCRGKLWLFTEDGEFSYDPRSNKFTKLKNQLFSEKSPTSYRTALSVNDSTIYLGTMNRGLLKYSIPESRFSAIKAVDENAVMWIEKHGKNLYVGTDGAGVNILSIQDEKIIKRIRHHVNHEKSDIRSNSVYAGFVDHDSLLWVGLYQYGIDYMPYLGNLFEIYKLGDFTTEQIPVRALIIRDNEKWIGTRLGFYYLDERTGDTRHFGTSEMRSDIISCLYDFKGKILIGTIRGGMYIWDSDTKQIKDFDVQTPIPFVNGSVFGASEDLAGHLWLGTSDGAFCYASEKEIRHFTTSNSQLPGLNVYDIFFDSTGRGWLATDKGLCIWNSVTGRIEKEGIAPSILDREKVSKVYEDSKHNLYFILHNGELWKSDLRLEKIENITQNGYLSKVKVVSVIDDNDGGIWMGTNNGLYHFDKKKSLTVFGKSDGVISPIFLNCAPKYDSDGTLWIGNSSGLLFLRKDWAEKTKLNNRVPIITEVMVNGNELMLPVEKNSVKHITLSESQDNITIYFSDLAFSNPEDATWECKLEGKDEDWIKLDGKSEVTYYHINKGDSKFIVRLPGVESTETCLIIHRKSSFKAILAIIGIFIIMMILGIFYMKIRRKRVNGKEGQHIVESEITEPKKEKYKGVSMTEQECCELVKRLEGHMKTKKAFLNPTLKIADLAKEIGCSTYALSYLFSQHMESSYSEYITSYRIKEFVRLIDAGKHTDYTLDSLMTMSGFISRTSFFRHFKKVYGKTPAEYIRGKSE